MTKKQSELEKAIKEADQAIKAAEAAKAKRRQAEKELRAYQQKTHLDRLYNIGRIAYETGAHQFDDMVLAGIFARAIELIDNDHKAIEKLRSIGTNAIDAVRKTVPLEVLLPDRPNRSTSAILREAGMKKGTDVILDGERWTRYSGEAAKAYLDRRLENTRAVIKVTTS